MSSDISTEIINLSLDILNVDTIDSIDNTDDIVAKKVRSQLDLTRVKVLAQFPWGFAKKVFPLDNITKFAGYYTLPADWIVAFYPKIEDEKVFFIEGSSKYERTIKFTETNTSDKAKTYIFNAPFYLWDNLCIDFFVTMLAYDLSIMFSKSVEKMAFLKAQLDSKKKDINNIQRNDLTLKILTGRSYGYETFK